MNLGQSGWFLPWVLKLSLILYLGLPNMLYLSLPLGMHKWANWTNISAKMQLLVLKWVVKFYVSIFLVLQRVDSQLKTLERTNFSKKSLIRVAVVGCGYSGVELAATISERLQDRGLVQAINLENTICPTAPPGNREAALKVCYRTWDTTQHALISSTIPRIWDLW